MNRSRRILLAAALLGGAAQAQDDPRPWPPSYKIAPHETERLTAADVVGPDGLVYPDWRHAGVPGGIPEVPIRAQLPAFGAIADDGKDDSAALRRAIAAVAAGGGGAIELGEGSYHLDTPVVITEPGIVIRGAGRDRTRLVFRYELPESPHFATPPDGSTVSAGTIIEMRGQPGDLKNLRFFVGSREIHGVPRPTSMAKTFRLVITGEELVAAAGPGRHVLEASRPAEDGAPPEVVARLRFDVDRVEAAAPGSLRFSRHLKGLGALSFCGDGTTGRRWRLGSDGLRGDRSLHLDADHDLRPGDRIAVTAPATERWNALVGNECAHGEYRVYYYQVEGAEGRRIELNQALRFDFPVADGSFVQRIHPVTRCGVEDLCIVQTSSPWTCGVFLCDAWECWVSGVRVEDTGRMPVLLEWGKWCEVRDCEFFGAREVGGGGTGYVGWQRATDCLMTDVHTRGMRHAPLFEWAASGNVIRNGLFEDSDMQWHAGWTNENLIENCVVHSTRKYGGYGYGGWASPPQDRKHGPNGPRNVVYGCDLRSPRAGLFLGGSNEAWLVLHSRFVVESGPGVIVQRASFDHIFEGNVFVLRQASRPLLLARTPDCVGIELRSNRIHGGSGTLAQGVEVVEHENSIHAIEVAAERPIPTVPSIFEWQRRGR